MRVENRTKKKTVIERNVIQEEEGEKRRNDKYKEGEEGKRNKERRSVRMLHKNEN